MVDYLPISSYMYNIYKSFKTKVPLLANNKIHPQRPDVCTCQVFVPVFLIFLEFVFVSLSHHLVFVSVSTSCHVHIRCLYYVVSISNIQDSCQDPKFYA